MSNTLGSRALRAVIWEQCGGVCHYCRKPMNPFLDFSIDHRIATRNGGSDDLSNLIGSCKRCNSSKGARPESGSLLASMSLEEAERHRLDLARSTAVSSLLLNSEGRPVNVRRIAETLGIQMFQLTPGGRFRVSNEDFRRIAEYARAHEQQEDRDGNE